MMPPPDEAPPMSDAEYQMRKAAFAEKEVILYSPDEIHLRVETMAHNLRQKLIDGGYEHIYFVMLLEGALPLYEALHKAVFDWQFDAVWQRRKKVMKQAWSLHPARARSYAGGTKRTVPKIKWGWDCPKVGVDECVVIVDDIVDSGDTMRAVIGSLRDNSDYLDDDEERVITVALLRRHGCTFDPTFVGFELEGDQYVYGFGMDDAEGRSREKPYVAFKESTTTAAT